MRKLIVICSIYNTLPKLVMNTINSNSFFSVFLFLSSVKSNNNLELVTGLRCMADCCGRKTFSFVALYGSY